jgi:hypothetical protein
MKHISYTKEGGQIPPEFGSTSDTLLVISDPKDYMAYNKYLKRNFEENYTKKYKIIKSSELKSYPSDHYRYSFDHLVTLVQESNTSQTGRTYYTTRIAADRFYILDRKTEVKYLTDKSSYFSKLMKGYIVALNEAK